MIQGRMMKISIQAIEPAPKENNRTGMGNFSYHLLMMFNQRLGNFDCCLSSITDHWISYGVESSPALIDSRPECWSEKNRQLPDAVESMT